MPNALVQAYKEQLKLLGVTDPRPDDYITLDLGNAASQANRGLFDQYPDFAQEYGSLREANAPSLLGEAGQAIKAGTIELGATAAGVGALVTGSDWLKKKAQEFAESAAESAPTIPTIEDIGPGRSTLGKVFSKDAARYAISKFAGAIPSLAETLGLAAAGGAIGSAVEPGAGTVAGATEGALEGILGRGIIKSAIKRLVSKTGEAMVASKFIPEATEAAVAAAVRAGSKDVIGLVTQEAKQIAARRAFTLTNVANIYGLSAGGIYNETGNRGVAAGMGAVAALPMLILPEIVNRKLFPDVTAAVGKKLGADYVTRLATQTLLDSGLMTGVMAVQQATNVIARNISQDKPATEFTTEDWKGIREAAISGAAMGPLVAPLTAMRTRPMFAPVEARARAEAARKAVAQKAISEPVPAREPAVAPAGEPAPTLPRVADIPSMPEAERVALLTQLDQKPGRTPEEERLYQVLKATTEVPEAAPTAPTEKPGIKLFGTDDLTIGTKVPIGFDDITRVRKGTNDAGKTVYLVEYNLGGKVRRMVG